MYSPKAGPWSPQKDRRKNGACRSPWVMWAVGWLRACSQQALWSLPQGLSPGSLEETLTILLGLDVEHAAAHSIPSLGVGQHLHAIVGEFLHASQLHSLTRGGDVLHLTPLCRRQTASECSPGRLQCSPPAFAPPSAWDPVRLISLGSDLENM